MNQWTEAISLYVAWLSAGNASPGTIKIRRSYLTRLAAHLPGSPWDVTPTDLYGWMANPAWSAETKKCARSSVRSFYRWATLSDHADHDPAGVLPPIKVPRGRARPAPDRIVNSAIDRADYRERLMILLASRGGLRRGEIARVYGTDLQDGDNLRVNGKGGHVRLVPILDDELLEALRGAGARPLFPGNDHGHISPDWVGVLLARLLGEGWTGHTLRHRCATRAYAGTHNLRAVQELLGHASPTTTARYTAVVDDDLRAAVAAAA